MHGGIPPGAVKRLLIVMPTWLGDCVMATPTLRALRGLYPDAHVKALIGRNVRPILDHTPWIDALVTVRRKRRDPVSMSRRLALGRFDAAVLLPNSFRSAALVAMAGIGRRVGYDRDGRGFLLTDRLIPRKQSGRFIPVPALEYYLGIARYLGVNDPDTMMRLYTRPEDDAAADALLDRAGFNPAGDRRLVILNPGAQKSTKRWPPERFAKLAERCTDAFGVAAAVTGAPNERPILREVIESARCPVINLLDHGMDLRLLKSVMRRASLLVTNDTGPRHIAAAMGTPVVTLFGPTGPAWTQIGFADERQIVAEPTREPSVGRVRRSMRSIDVDTVFARSAELLSPSVGAPA